MHGTQDASHILQLDNEKLIYGDREDSEDGNSGALFHNSNKEMRVAVRSDDFLCVSDHDGLNHIETLLKSKYAAKDMGTLGFEDSDATSLLLLNRVFGVETDQNGQFLDIELDWRHALLIIKESGCNVNTKTVITQR